MVFFTRRLILSSAIAHMLNSLQAGLYLIKGSAFSADMLSFMSPGQGKPLISTSVYLFRNIRSPLGQLPVIQGQSAMPWRNFVIKFQDAVGSAGTRRLAPPPMRI